jgi:hypothetical protein
MEDSSRVVETQANLIEINEYPYPYEMGKEKDGEEEVLLESKVEESPHSPIA